jgi:cysteine synthase A
MESFETHEFKIPYMLNMLISSQSLIPSKLAPSIQETPLCSDITEAIGNVPIVRLNRIHPQCQQHSLYLKLESCNPGGSIKEKNAVYLIREAEKQGLLQAGGTIVESSSGNFGIGLAMLGALKGYRVMIVVDAKTSPTIRRMLIAYGAELVEVPLSEADAQGSMQVARMQKALE